MRLLVLTILILVSLAGCVSEEPDAEGPTPTTAAPTGPPEAPVLGPLSLLGKGAGEPNIAVGPDGTIYVTGIRPLWRSTDGGATWVEGATRTDGGGDGDIGVDGTGRLHWLGLFGDAGPIPYQYSDDMGDTWSESFDPSNDTGSDREWIEVLANGTVYGAWRGSGDDGSEVTFMASYDRGENWTVRSRMSDDAVGGPLVAGNEPGHIFQAQATFESGVGSQDASIRFVRSLDGGHSWEAVTAVTPTQSVQFGLIGFPFAIFPAAAMDDAGRLYIVFSSDTEAFQVEGPKPAARFGVYLVTSDDLGMTWSTPELLSDPDHAAIMPWIAAGAGGNIAVTWYENTAGAPHDNVPDIWNVRLMEAFDWAGDRTTFEVQLNDEPVHTGSVCTSGTGCLISGGDRSLLDFFEVALTTDGHPAVTWAATAAPYEGTATNIDIYARVVTGGTPLT